MKQDKKRKSKHARNVCAVSQSKRKKDEPGRRVVRKEKKRKASCKKVKDQPQVNGEQQQLKQDQRNKVNTKETLVERNRQKKER